MITLRSAIKLLSSDRKSVARYVHGFRYIQEESLIIVILTNEPYIKSLSLAFPM